MTFVSGKNLGIEFELPKIKLVIFRVRHTDPHPSPQPSKNGRNTKRRAMFENVFKYIEKKCFRKKFVLEGPPKSPVFFIFFLLTDLNCQAII